MFLGDFNYPAGNIRRDVTNVPAPANPTKVFRCAIVVPGTARTSFQGINAFDSSGGVLFKIKVPAPFELSPR
jgi:hypothetical protein